jgi:hypothetical protein
VVQGLRFEAVKDAEGETWTVLPVGLKHSGMTGVGEIVLSRLLKRTADFRTDPLPSSTSSLEEAGATTKEIMEALEDALKDDGVPGEEDEDIPFDPMDWEFFDERGQEISYEVWQERVKCGCQVCSEPISPTSEFEWDDVTGQPVCEDCVEEFDEATAKAIKDAAASGSL